MIDPDSFLKGAAVLGFTLWSICKYRQLAYLQGPGPVRLSGSVAAAGLGAIAGTLASALVLIMTVASFVRG